MVEAGKIRSGKLGRIFRLWGETRKEFLADHTEEKPAQPTGAATPAWRPANPTGWLQSPSTGKWKDPRGKIFNADGSPAQ